MSPAHTLEAHNTRPSRQLHLNHHHHQHQPRRLADRQPAERLDAASPASSKVDEIRIPCCRLGLLRDHRKHAVVEGEPASRGPVRDVLNTPGRGPEVLVANRAFVALQDPLDGARLRSPVCPSLVDR